MEPSGLLEWFRSSDSIGVNGPWVPKSLRYRCKFHLTITTKQCSSNCRGEEGCGQEIRGAVWDVPLVLDVLDKCMSNHSFFNYSCFNMGIIVRTAMYLGQRGEESHTSTLLTSRAPPTHKSIALPPAYSSIKVQSLLSTSLYNFHVFISIWHYQSNSSHPQHVGVSSMFADTHFLWYITYSVVEVQGKYQPWRSVLSRLLYLFFH